MQKEPINTSSIEQFIKQVKAADASNSRDVKLDIDTAKNLSYTLGIVLARLNGNLEELIQKNPQEDEVIQVQMDGGKDW